MGQWWRKTHSGMRGGNDYARKQVIRYACASLDVFEFLVIFGVWSNPIPENMIAFAQAQGTVTNANANRINGLPSANAFKLQARMKWILQL